LTFIISIVVLVTIATVGALRLFPREQPAAVPPPVPAPAERGALTLRTIPLVGVVDSGRVLNESARALAYQRQLDEREKAAAGELEILAQSASSQEVDRRRQQLLAELDNLRTRLKRQLDADLAQAVATVANRRGPMIAVISKKGTLYLREPNAVDITDDVIGELR
jgi:Skp family chaperone for outer membrane proteins